MSNFVTYLAELNATMYRCNFPQQFSPSACSPTKGLASMHFSILQPILLLCGYTSAELATQHFPYLVVNRSLVSFWMRSLFHLRSSYRIRSPLNNCVFKTTLFTSHAHKEDCSLHVFCRFVTVLRLNQLYQSKAVINCIDQILVYIIFMQFHWDAKLKD